MTDTSYEIRWTEEALRLLTAIQDRRVQKRLVDAAESLRLAPERKGKPLWGPLQGYRSLRAAGQRYRILFLIEQRRVIVWIAAVGLRKDGDRSDIYELARKLIRQGLL